MDILGCSLQLFQQPSLTNVYLRNNRSMTNYDFILQFPSIPILFGLSSDLASGWSKLIYDQALINRNISPIDVEVLGLGPTEAHSVENCVKLLFGFKVIVEPSQLWLFLRVSDMLGICQSPLSPTDIPTVQEVLLSYANAHINELNLVEGWDYVLSVLEGDSFIIRRTQIKQLAQEVLESAKKRLQISQFEALCNYGFDQNTQGNMFSMRDLKREHYIQLRTAFYRFISQIQEDHLNANQQLVRVLMEELDQVFELDGYVNTKIDQINIKIELLSQRTQDVSHRQSEETSQLAERVNIEFRYIRNEMAEIRKEAVLQRMQQEGMLRIQGSCFHRDDNILYLGTNNGLVEVLKDIEGQRGRIINCGQIDEVRCITTMNQQLFIGNSKGQVLQYQTSNYDRIRILIKSNTLCQVNYLIPLKNKYLMAAYSDGSVVAWDPKQGTLLYDSGPLATSIRVLYTHSNLGDFIAIGESEGYIRLSYFNNDKSSLEQIKKFKSSQSAVSALVCIPTLNEYMLAVHIDRSVYIWNWEQETLLTIITLESSSVSLQAGILDSVPYFLCLLGDGVIQLYQFDKNRIAKFIHQVSSSNTAITLSPTSNPLYFRIIHHNGTQTKLALTSLSITILTNPQLSLHTQFQLHSSCVYTLTQLSYPYFVSGSDDRTLRVFHLGTHESQKLLKGHQAYVRAVVLLHDSRHIASGSYDSSVKVWDLQVGVCLNTLTGHVKPVLALRSLEHTDALFVSAGEDAMVKCWNYKLAQCIWTIESGKNEVWSLLPVHDTTSNQYGLLTGHKDGLVRLLNVGEKGDQNSLERETKAHKSFVNCMIVLEDQLAATASSDNLINIFNWKSGTIIRILKGHNDIVWDVGVIFNNIIMSSSSEGTIKLWNWQTGVCLNTAHYAKGSIYTLLKAQNSNKILSGTASGEILVWKIKPASSNKLSSIIL